MLRMEAYLGSHNSKSIAQLALKVTLPESQDHHEEELDSLFDLSPIQKLYFKCVGENFNHFNQSVRVRLTRNTTPERMAFAVESLVLSHSMLRARFFKNEVRDSKLFISSSLGMIRISWPNLLLTIAQLT